MTGAGGVAVAQAASVLSSSSTKTPKLSLVLAINSLCTLDPLLLGQADLLQGPRMLCITPRLVPLVRHPRPAQCRCGVCQYPHGQASGG